MKQDELTGRVCSLADAVLADSRFTRDDLNVSILGMILYGLALAIARKNGLTEANADAALLACMTGPIGAAPKWSGGFVAEAATSARDEEHHYGHYELIEVGRTYAGVANQRAVVDNVFANFCSVRKGMGLPEPMVTVFLNPLAVLLAGREKQKGAPLTEAEVLEVRDTAVCTQMSLSQAGRFYASLDLQMPIPRLNPERIWEEWQALRKSQN